MNSILQVFSEEFISKVVFFMQGIHVRKDFWDTFSALTDSYLEVLVLWCNFIMNSDILLYGFIICFTLFISKSAFKWFKTLAK